MKLAVTVLMSFLLSGCSRPLREKLDGLEWDIVNNKRRLNTLEQALKEKYEEERHVYRAVPSPEDFECDDCNLVEPVIIDYKCVNGELYEKYHEDIYLKQEGKCKTLIEAMK